MFAGAEEGIFCTLNSLLKSGDHVIVIAPCYQSVKSIPEAICDVSMVDLDFSEGWNLDLLKVESSIIPCKTKLLLINFPNNPTGACISPTKLNQLIEMARKYDIWIFSDEIYHGIDRMLPEDVCPPITSIYEKGISLSGVSKSHGLPGLRIGWIVCQDSSLLEKIASNKHYLSICNSAPSEILAIIAVRYRHLLWERNFKIVQENLQIFRSFIMKYSDLFEWIEPTGGCCGFMRIKFLKDDDPNFMNNFVENLANSKRLLLLPGQNFPCTKENESLIRSFVRIGYGRKNFPRALQVFEEALQEYLQR
jgi:aspartate/methionine/tyrosine aminotransferase